MGEYKTILVNRESFRLVVWMNRPEVRNALNEKMIAELTDVFRNVAAEEGLRCIVLRGKGKSFCAGADLNYMRSIADFGYDENLADARRLAELFEAVYLCPLPTISVVHGAAFGGANGLLSACDMVIASADTVFSFSEVKLGIAPATISPYVIRRIGEYGAKELMLTGKKFSSSEAGKWNLINLVVSEDKLDDAVQEFTNQFITAAPEAVKETKKLIRHVVSSHHEDLNDFTAELIAQLRASDEAREGMNAFFEKRKPGWSNPTS